MCQRPGSAGQTLSFLPPRQLESRVLESRAEDPASLHPVPLETSPSQAHYIKVGGVMSSLSLVIFFTLKSTLSDFNYNHSGVLLICACVMYFSLHFILTSLYCIVTVLLVESI